MSSTYSGRSEAVPKDRLTEELYAMFANTRMEATRSYLERGRPFQRETGDDLKTKWIAQLTAMADALPEFNRQLLDDLEAEHGLRGIETPANEVPDIVDRLRARSKAHTKSWSPEEEEEAERKLQRELDKVRPSRADKN
jgi:hypothetical protein